MSTVTEMVRRKPNTKFNSNVRNEPRGLRVATKAKVGGGMLKHNQVSA